MSLAPSRRSLLQATLLLPALILLPARAAQRRGPRQDPLPSWRPGPARDRILAFLGSVTTAGGPLFVPPEKRIVVFDNDGTLWSEQPMYVQLAFALDRARALGIPTDPAELRARGNTGLLDLVTRTHGGLSTETFAALVRTWLAEARHPTLGVPYTALAYQPMLELLAAFRAAGFRTWIVSGGGLDFLRVFSSELYGIPPEQVIGSSVVTTYEERNGEPELRRQSRLDFLDDGPGKPVGIHRAIGRRPIAAFGNSDGDYEMLRWTTAGPGPSLGMLVHHDDARREVAYDRASPIGRLDRALDEAPARGWSVISMRRDWSQVYRGLSEAQPPLV